MGQNQIKDGLAAWEQGAYDLLEGACDRAGELAQKLKAKVLTDSGWKEVPGEAGGTAWMFMLAGTPHYFDLEGAYELETSGAGHSSLLAEEAIAGLLSANDVALGEAQEAAYYAEHGVHRGIPPNY